ncbi:hypothetical protein [Bradyrhizobium sp. SZCCHNRI3043]|uniref:hypothetical protein n=1 Tax=Bradyrhizobium sp. SZCCHNRI3043 TaxID=3057292 RepID=UPI0028E3B9C2|nr:hypothetical protein [Bradyrhizobium sp. SZCCHNRI3043]
MLSNDIVAGELSVPSIANARHMRRADSGLFNWAVEAGRDYVTASPCVNLPKLDSEHPRTRVLSEDEIRAFWHGPDRARQMRGMGRVAKYRSILEISGSIRSSHPLSGISAMAGF